MSGKNSKMNGKSFSKLSSNEQNAVKALLNMRKGTMKSRRHSMFAPRPGQAKKPGKKSCKKLTKKEANNIGQRFFPKRNPWSKFGKQCVGTACKRSYNIAKKTLSMASRLSRSMTGKGKK
jgi:hypothetical protein